jgi:signal transduction histidine kinase
LSDVKKDFEEVIQHKNAVIEATRPCKVDVIPFQFRQLLHNLVSNSLKFFRPDVPTHVIIKSKVVFGRTLHHHFLLPDKKYCHIIYTDNGIGFDPQYKDRIFEAFQRLNSVVEFPGTGIGLAICKRIIENHNGFITANGKLNEGVRFDIYIPSENK